MAPCLHGHRSYHHACCADNVDGIFHSEAPFFCGGKAYLGGCERADTAERQNDPNYSKNDRYETYYSYKLTWQFMDPDSEKKYTFIREEEAAHPNAHEYGEKQTAFVYNNDDESDFEIMDYFASVIIAIAGLGLIVFPTVDIIRAAVKKKRIIERDRKAALNRAKN